VELPKSVQERLDRLAPDQRAAATSPSPPGQVLCVAPAGSGKTTTLVARIAWLVGSGVAGPDEIAAITFNKRAAEELRVGSIRHSNPLTSSRAPSGFGPFMRSGARSCATPASR
jgi:hypothetical protein